MLCPNCGVSNVDYALFCFKCGANIKQVSSDSKEKQVSSTGANKETSLKHHETSQVGIAKLLDKTFFISTLFIAALFIITGYYYAQIVAIEDPVLSNALYIITWIAAAYAVCIICIFLYRAWLMLQGHGARTTPGRAVGFLFIPLFNLYWVFQAIWGFAKDYNNIIQNIGSKAPKLPESVFLFTSFFILFLPLVLIVSPEILVTAVVISFLVFAYLFVIVSSSANALSAAGKSTVEDADTLRTRLSLSTFIGDSAKVGGTVFALLLVLALLAAFFMPRGQYEVIGVTCPEQIVHGEKLVVAVDAANVGTAEGGFNLTLFIDDKEIEAKNIVLDAGTVEKVNFNLTDKYSPGSYQYSLGLGADKVIYDEFDGEFRILKPAEFTLSNFSVNPTQIDITEEASVSVNISNVGEASGEYNVPLTVNGVVLKESDITLAGGESTTVDYVINMDEPGLFSLELNGMSETLEIFRIERPDNGTVFTNEVRGGSGHFRIKNDREKDVLVILSKPEKPQETLLAVYVHGKNSKSISGIRDGVYEIYFSHGEDWDSHSNRFTRNIEHYRFDGTQQVVTTSTTYTSFWVELGVIGVETEARTEGVDAEEFPTF